MALDLHDCQFHGPALPEPFVKFELEKELTKRKLLVKTTGDEGRVLQAQWDSMRRRLQGLAASGGPLRVFNHVIEPLMPLVHYSRYEDAPLVQTREDQEAGGTLLMSGDSTVRLRVWTTAFNEDLYAPARRGRAYRFSHLRIAQRVLLTTGERVGLLTNGVQLLLLISDPARPDSTVTIPLDPGWKRQRAVPDSLRLVIALSRPEGLQALPDLVDTARLQQARVTRELRVQARQAVERFIQEVLEHPENRDWFLAHPDRDALATILWHEGLITVYRLLFIFKLEASDDVARSFTFASTSLWRNTFSPSMALASYARGVLEHGVETGSLLEGGLRTLFKMFDAGLECTELHVKPLGGALFGGSMTPVLTQRTWGERAVAHLLDRLLWTPRRRGADTRERVHYGPLDVEDLGRVYEALLELEPGISSEPMCRLRRHKLEVVVPLAQGERYRPAQPLVAGELPDTEDTDTEDTDSEDEEASPRGKKTKVEWMEAIPPHRFYLRIGLGRKASGSYYTPHAFVRFLVQETLGPQVAERSPQDDPQPLAILKLKVLDPAMGSGHFLVEACRFLGEKLYEACRLCDDRALAAERRAEKAGKAECQVAFVEAQQWRQRILDLPDPQDELVKYLPSRSPEGEETGYSQQRAEALCRRLVAVHCLYGVDKNPLAVELAKLSLWLESYGEGLPLTFLDHRLLFGDSLTGPFFEHLLTYPGSGEQLDGLFVQGLTERLTTTLNEALVHVQTLEASVGKNLSDIEQKRAAKAHLDAALAPLQLLASAWSGGVMLGNEACDDTAYEALLRTVVEHDNVQEIIAHTPSLRHMVETGKEGVAYDLVFPEVFYPAGTTAQREGFDAVLGNPPWDALQPLAKEFYAAFDLRILDASTRLERAAIEKRLTADAGVKQAFGAYVAQFDQAKRFTDRCYQYVNRQAHGLPSGAVTDLWQVFAERGMQNLRRGAYIGWVLPSAFHANQSATGIRTLYISNATLKCCYSFENRNKLFEIHASFKFAPVVAQKTIDSYAEFPCAFYLDDLDWLFQDHEPLQYSPDFVRETGGEYLSFLELRSHQDAEVARVSYARGASFGAVRQRLAVRLGVEMDMSKAAHLFTPINAILSHGEDPRDPDVAGHVRERGYLPLHEGKTFHQYDDRWEERPRYLVHLDQIRDKPTWLTPSRYFRLAFRDIARATDERTGIFCILPAGVVFGNKAPCERDPARRPFSSSLSILAMADSFCFDFLLRFKVQATVNLFILDTCPLPALAPFTSPITRFLTHSALRLTCNHAGYASLWYEQLGHTWREPSTTPFTWPVLEGNDARWAVRAVIDAVVADAYGLTREQYTHVLSTFNHKSYPKALELCLARFDELQTMGLEAFAQRYDPYWDIPLNENLPQPVIDFPVPTGGSGESDSASQSTEALKQRRRRAKQAQNQLSMEL
jgi:hypothetical protein